jgi:hypothetical protein
MKKKAYNSERGGGILEKFEIAVPFCKIFVQFRFRTWQHWLYRGQKRRKI